MDKRVVPSDGILATINDGLKFEQGRVSGVEIFLNLGDGGLVLIKSGLCLVLCLLSSSLSAKFLFECPD